MQLSRYPRRVRRFQQMCLASPSYKVRSLRRGFTTTALSLYETVRRFPVTGGISQSRGTVLVRRRQQREQQTLPSRVTAVAAAARSLSALLLSQPPCNREIQASTISAPVPLFRASEVQHIVRRLQSAPTRLQATPSLSPQRLHRHRRTRRHRRRHLPPHFHLAHPRPSHLQRHRRLP